MLTKFVRITLPVTLVALLLAQNRNIPIENEFVRVLSLVDPPAAKAGGLHEHKQNRVNIYLDAAHMQLKYSDGRVEDQHWKPGDFAWSPADGYHTSQNLSNGPVRVIHIELKKPGTDAGRAVGPGSSNIENSLVRIYRAAKASPTKNYVAVDLVTGVVLWNRLPDGPGPFVIAEMK